MQLKRDYLNKRVLPIIRDYSLKYHEFVDLRFSIDIGNSNAIDKVVNTCPDEIDRCKLLFIAFIGNR